MGQRLENALHFTDEHRTEIICGVLFLVDVAYAVGNAAAMDKIDGNTAHSQKNIPGAVAECDNSAESYRDKSGVILASNAGKVVAKCINRPAP